MSNLTTTNEEIKAGQVWIIPVFDEVTGEPIGSMYDVAITRVNESVHMTCLTTGKTGIESLTSFQANVADGNYIEIL